VEWKDAGVVRLGVLLTEGCTCVRPTVQGPQDRDGYPLAGASLRVGDAVRPLLLATPQTKKTDVVSRGYGSERKMRFRRMNRLFYHPLQEPSALADSVREGKLR
jgi:hypothetical protein